MARAELQIEGMSCMHCVKAVDKAIKEIKGVRTAQVEVGKAVIDYDDTQTSLDEIKYAVKTAGYKVKE